MDEEALVGMEDEEALLGMEDGGEGGKSNEGIDAAHIRGATKPD
jgi:hypothetical protein